MCVMFHHTYIFYLIEKRYANETYAIEKESF